jgi:3-mercaptopropionate dioxygenase
MVDGLARFRRFLGDLTRLCDAGADEETIRACAGASLHDLVSADDWLPAKFAKPDPVHYRQYLLYCDPLERFSVVSFVWGAWPAYPRPRSHRVGADRHVAGDRNI